MVNYVKQIIAHGIHGRFDIEQEFKPGVNVLYGKNGTGKTTLLHILANILNGDYQRFAFLSFNFIRVELNNGFSISLNSHSQDRELYVTLSVGDQKILDLSVDELRKWEDSSKYPDIRRLVNESLKSAKPPLAADYFPAFRNMIEAWSSIRDDGDISRGRVSIGAYEDPVVRRYLSSENRPISATRFARSLFGPFVPRISYPSPIEIEEKLRAEIQEALITVGNTDRRLLSQAFRDIYIALSKETSLLLDQPEKILEQIRTLSQRLKESSLPIQTETMIVDEELRKLFYSAKFRGDADNLAAPILEVYRKALDELVQVQENSFKDITRYLDSVNDFLEQKRLEIRPREERSRNSLISIVFDDNSTGDLRSLSSGERQIVALIYAATHMSSKQVVLIDEPEISLHIDWQRMLLKKMAEQLPDRQIIACTHSPVIGADSEDAAIDLVFTPTKKYTQSDLFDETSESDDEAF